MIKARKRMKNNMQNSSNLKDNIKRGYFWIELRCSFGLKLVKKRFPMCEVFRFCN